MGVRFEHGDIDRWIVDLDEAGRVAPRETRQVVQKGALNIKTGARRRIGRPPHAPAYASAITYDTEETATGASAEIGPDKGRPQGALGNLLEYGSINNAPIPHIRPSADEELPKFEKAMEDLGVTLLENR